MNKMPKRLVFLLFAPMWLATSPAVAAGTGIARLDTPMLEEIAQAARDCSAKHPALPDDAALCFMQWFDPNPKYRQPWSAGFPLLGTKAPLDATLLTPLQSVRDLAVQQLRSAEPVKLPNADKLNVVTVRVMPTRFDSPNVTKVLIAGPTGELVTALDTSITSKVYQNNFGASTTKSEAVVTYPLDTFLSGPFTVTFVTGAGNLTAPIRPSDLTDLR